MSGPGVRPLDHAAAREIARRAVREALRGLPRMSAAITTDWVLGAMLDEDVWHFELYQPAARPLDALVLVEAHVHRLTGAVTVSAHPERWASLTIERARLLACLREWDGRLAERSAVETVPMPRPPKTAWRVRLMLLPAARVHRPFSGMRASFVFGGEPTACEIRLLGVRNPPTSGSVEAIVRPLYVLPLHDAVEAGTRFELSVGERVLARGEVRSLLALPSR